MALCVLLLTPSCLSSSSITETEARLATFSDSLYHPKRLIVFVQNVEAEEEKRIDSMQAYAKLQAMYAKHGRSDNGQTHTAATPV